jgi:Protein of unknown function (DUF2877)
MSRLAAASIGPPVLEAVGVGDTGVVSGSGSSAAYVRFGGFVVAVTAPGVPLMPNAISLASAPPDGIRSGARAVRHSNGFQMGDAFVDCAHITLGTSTIPVNARATATRIAERALDLLRWGATTLDDRGRQAIGALGEALGGRGSRDLRPAVEGLLGLGPGLTPEGDDLVAGCAAGIVAFGGPAGLGAALGDRWLADLCPPDAHARTTALSVTLLELACSGHVAEPLATVLDLESGPERCRRAARALETIGHSTGRAWMTGSGVAATGLASSALVSGPIWI